MVCVACGAWCVAHGAWRMAHGVWRTGMKCGLWPMACRSWLMAHGSWPTAHGHSPLVHGPWVILTFFGTWPTPVIHWNEDVHHASGSLVAIDDASFERRRLRSRAAAPAEHSTTAALPKAPLLECRTLPPNSKPAAVAGLQWPNSPTVASSYVHVQNHRTMSRCEPED